MTADAIRATDRAAHASLAFLQHLLRDYHPRSFAFRLWDGTTWEPDPGQPARFTLVLRHPGALRRMLWPPSEATLGEAYIYDDFDIEGDIAGVFPVGDWFFERRWTAAERLHLAWGLLGLPASRPPRAGRQAAQLRGRRHSITRDRQAIAYHYDVSNDFFRLW